MSFEITQNEDYFLITFIGNFDKKTMASAYVTLIKNTDFSQESCTLWDFRNVSVNLSFQCIQENASALNSYNNKRSSSARSAFIVSDLCDKAILETYITAIAHYPVEFNIFDSFSHGVSWLKNK